jgi:Tfp pilus assembly protein PilO
MKMTNREAVLALTTLAAAIFGVSIVLARPRMADWGEARRRQAALREEVARDTELVAEREQWVARYAEVSGMLSRHPPTQKMDAYWMSVMDRLAAKHGLNILERKPGKEIQAGEVFELPIEVKTWDGSLDALVHFLFDMESEGAMLDIRHLLVKPKPGGLLGGQFTLYCAYMRESA